MKIISVTRTNLIRIKTPLNLNRKTLQGILQKIKIKEPGTKAWIIDSGSTFLITNDETLFTKIKSKKKTNAVIANGKNITSYGSGKTEIITKSSDDETHNIKLKEILYETKIEKKYSPLVKLQKKWLQKSS